MAGPYGSSVTKPTGGSTEIGGSSYEPWRVRDRLAAWETLQASRSGSLSDSDSKSTAPSVPFVRNQSGKYLNSHTAIVPSPQSPSSNPSTRQWRNDYTTPSGSVGVYGLGPGSGNGSSNGLGSAPEGVYGAVPGSGYGSGNVGSGKANGSTNPTQGRVASNPNFSNLQGYPQTRVLPYNYPNQNSSVRGIPEPNVGRSGPPEPILSGLGNNVGNGYDSASSGYATALSGMGRGGGFRNVGNYAPKNAVNYPDHLGKRSEGAKRRESYSSASEFEPVTDVETLAEYENIRRQFHPRISQGGSPNGIRPRQQASSVRENTTTPWWQEVYHLDWWPREMFVKFRQRVSSCQIGANIEMRRVDISGRSMLPENSVQSGASSSGVGGVRKPQLSLWGFQASSANLKLVIKPAANNRKWKVLIEPQRGDVRFLTRKIPVLGVFNVQFGLGHDFRQNATGWKWRVTSPWSGDSSLSKIRHKNTLPVAPGFDMRVGWNCEYVLPDLHGSVGTGEPVLGLNMGRVYASVERIEAIFTSFD